jgi:hypothetical protein
MKVVPIAIPKVTLSRSFRITKERVFVFYHADGALSHSWIWEHVIGYDGGVLPPNVSIAVRVVQKFFQ